MTVDLRIAARPWDWPLLGPVPAERLAVVVIDMQQDFLAQDGYFASMGFDTAGLRAIVPALGDLVGSARAAGALVVHTRQGNADDLSDLPATRLEQGRRHGTPIGTPGPLGRGLIRGEPGWQIVGDLAPLSREPVIDKPGYSAFAATELADLLRSRSVESIVLCGVTANVCVLATLLAAVDLGFDCLLVSDGVAAATAETTDRVLDLVSYQGGLFGSIATTAHVVDALRR